MAPRLSIVIVSWNVRDLLHECLESIQDSLITTSGDLPTEVIVIEIASTDQTADMIREHFPNVRLIEPGENVVVCQLHPDRGFHTFIREIHDVIDKSRHKALYVFDCLSELAANWCSDRMVGNFFMLTCPRLYDVGAIAYFSLLRDRHSFHATGPISDTTQVLIEVYRREGRVYVHPVKVQHRNSATMYMLHAWEGETFVPVMQSATTARILSEHPWNRLDIANYQLGFWSSTFIKAEGIQATAISHV